MVSSLLLIQTMLLYVLVQVHVPDTQWSQTNWNVGVWNKKMFTAGPYKELSGSCLKALNAPKGFSCVLMVVNIFHLLEREDVLHLQNNLGNVHQILLLSYLREELKQRMQGKESLSGKVPWCLALLHMDFPVGPVVKTPCFHCRGHASQGPKMAKIRCCCK